MENSQVKERITQPFKAAAEQSLQQFETYWEMVVTKQNIAVVKQKLLEMLRQMPTSGRPN
jgi:hypothetical protein